MILSSAQNKIIKKIISLKSKKGRYQQGQFIVEGKKPVREAALQNKIVFLVYCPELFDLKNELPAYMGDCYEASLSLFSKITTLENPEGVIAVLPFEKTAFCDLVLNGDMLILDKINDPGNAGAMIRSADAFGFANILALDGCVDLYSPKCIRSSMGSFLRVNFYQASIAQLIDYCKKETVSILGLDCNGEQLENDTSEFSKPVGLIIGSESHGIDTNLEEVINLRIKIPMTSSIESLNAAIAGSIMMSSIYQIRKNK
ncbi:MAG: hypothetical protein COA79_19470 [Planctomycetota bacterium]|nr:MAG: hypothetical protein COA79_19470 [Planctomycetota bacterium]